MIILPSQQAAIRFIEFETDALDNLDWIDSPSATDWSIALKIACVSHLPDLVHAQFIIDHPCSYDLARPPPDDAHSEDHERTV
jgi:hypothetical protein